ncbi:hypothetical protein Tco_0634815, partial [Tanacetum coccineum]
MGIRAILFFKVYNQAPRSWYETHSSFLLKNGLGRLYAQKILDELHRSLNYVPIKTATTPIVANKPLVKDKDGIDVDVHVYWSMIGSLMYLTASRPYIMFVVCACARFQVTPKASHLNAVKRIFRLRAIYDAELVSAASLVHTIKPTLSAVRSARKFMEVLPGKKIVSLFVITIGTLASSQTTIDGEAALMLLVKIARQYLGEPTEPQPTPSPTQASTEDQPPETSSSHATAQDSKDSLEGTNGNEGDQVQTPHDSPLSGGHTSNRAEGVLNLHELSVLCTNLSKRVLTLESIKDAQAAEISALKSRIKKLEKKCKPSILHHRAWLKSVKRLSIKKIFGKKEFVSKQGRKKSKPESTLVDSTVFDDQDADHGMEYMETEEAMDEGRQSGKTEEVKLTDDTKVVEDKSSGDKGGNVEELVSTARPEVSTTRPDIDAARQEDSVV